MNRIIIIGNGFDMAHNLKTGYSDFIESYWNNVTEKVYNGYNRWLNENWGGILNLRRYEDEFVIFEKGQNQTEFNKSSFSYNDNTSFGKLCKLIDEYNNTPNISVSVCLKFKNLFFERISNQCSLLNWVDIENEYYDTLKKLSLEENIQVRSQKAKTLNSEFNAIKKQLEEYLYNISKCTVNPHDSIIEAVNSLIELKDVALRKQQLFLDSILSEIQRFDNEPGFFEEMEIDPSYYLYSKDEAKRIHLKKKLENNYFKNEHCKPIQTLFLNFNYTNTAQNLYLDKESSDEVINIHGELNNKANPIIFGYGDELDDDYKRIERLQDNVFLENIKSIHYHKTGNYRKLLEFIESDGYQVFVMGHSCGNSDRTLLNTLFEHDNCSSIKVFYHQHDNESDNYVDLIKNISRNFNNKPKMRDIVVNRENCSPLVPQT